MNILRKTGFTILGSCWFVCSAAFGSEEYSENAQIVQIKDFYPIRSHSKDYGPEVFNVLDLSVEAKCGYARAMLSPASLDIQEAKFDRLWLELLKNSGQERFYQLTYGECVDDGVLITKIVDCAQGACGAKYKTDMGKMWLNTRSWAGNDTPMTINGEYMAALKKSSAQYFIKLPLKAAAKKNAWKVEIRYSENPDVVAMSAYIDKPDFLLGKFIHSYQARYLSGNLYSTGAFNGQGERQGKTTRYYDAPNKIQSVSLYQQGKLHGEYISWNENGTLHAKKLFRDGENVTKNGVVYGPNGEVLERYNYNDKGNKDGQQISYYPDGKIKESAKFVNGVAVEQEEHFWPDGKLKRRTTFENGHRVAIAQRYDNGQQESESFHNERYQNIGTHKTWYESGKQSSEHRYRDNGSRDSVTYWDKTGNLEYRKTFNHEDRLLSLENWFTNGERKKRKTYQGEQEVEETWYENGQLKEKLLLLNNKRTMSETWREDGTRSDRVIYDNNGTRSVIEIYDEAGKLQNRHNYDSHPR